MSWLLRGRLRWTALLLLLSAGVRPVQADDLPPLSAAAGDVHPAGVMLVSPLEIDDDGPDDRPLPADQSEFVARRDREAGWPTRIPELTTARDASVEFDYLRAGILLLCAGGATGGLWLTFVRASRNAVEPSGRIAGAPDGALHADFLERLIGARLPFVQEPLGSVPAARLHGRAVAVKRFRVEPVSTASSSTAAPSPPGTPVFAGGAGIHWVSAVEGELDAPHYREVREMSTAMPSRQNTTSGGAP